MRIIRPYCVKALNYNFIKVPVFKMLALPQYENIKPLRYEKIEK